MDDYIGHGLAQIVKVFAYRGEAFHQIRIMVLVGERRVHYMKLRHEFGFNSRGAAMVHKTTGSENPGSSCSLFMYLDPVHARKGFMPVLAVFTGVWPYYQFVIRKPFT